MRPSVGESFVGFTRDLEGACTWMYLDVLGYVTTGCGNMINTPQSAAALPWRRPDGSYATRDEVIADWALVRSRTDLERNGGGAYAHVAKLRLDAQGVSDLVRSTLERCDGDMKRRYPDWETWPACAQMACLSLAWACGDHYDFPHMDRALANRDFAEAAREVEMTPAHNPGNNLAARNRANEILMRNAQRVEAFHLDPDLLAWADDLSVADAPTIPALDDPDSEPNTTASCPTVYPSPLPYLGDDPDEKT